MLPNTHLHRLPLHMYLTYLISSSLAVRQTVEEDDEDAQLKELQAALAM